MELQITAAFTAAMEAGDTAREAGDWYAAEQLYDAAHKIALVTEQSVMFANGTSRKDIAKAITDGDIGNSDEAFEAESRVTVAKKRADAPRTRARIAQGRAAGTITT